MKNKELEELASLCIEDVKKEDMIWNNRFELTKYILNWMYNYMIDKYKLILSD